MISRSWVPVAVRLILGSWKRFVSSLLELEVIFDDDFTPSRRLKLLIVTHKARLFLVDLPPFGDLITDSVLHLLFTLCQLGPLCFQPLHLQLPLHYTFREIFDLVLVSNCSLVLG